jgi:hypothetical protein
MLFAYTREATEALEQLRKLTNLHWSTLPLVAVLLYVYAREIQEKNYGTLFTCLAFAGCGLLLEMLNGLILHWTGRAALWMAAGDSSYLIFVGINIEIILCFSIAWAAATRVLPEDREMKILGMPNRAVLAFAFGFFSMCTEAILNRAGLLVWQWWWFKWPYALPQILVFYSIVWYLLIRFYDADMSLKERIKAVGIIYLILIVAIVVFVWILKWA